MDINRQEELIISSASVDDAEDIVSFLNIIGGETDFLTFGLDNFPFSVQEEKNIITECGKDGQSLMLVGKIDNKIVSQLFIERSPMERLSHIGVIGITVARDHWRKSIGKKMMLSALEWAISTKITKLQLNVRCDNDHAIQLYKKLGFHIEGTVTRSVRIGDEYFDNYLMGLEC